MSIGFTVNADRVEAAMQRAPVEIGAALEETVTYGTIDFEGFVIDHTPVGATGHLRQSITHEITGRAVDMTGRVFSQDVPIKVASVETGRAPGKMPPRAPIALWVSRVLGSTDPGVVFMVQRAIGRRGTKGKFMFRDGFAQALPRVEQRVAALNARIRQVLT